MNINELDLSEFEYLGSEINYPGSDYVGYFDYFIYKDLMVCVIPSICIRFYDANMALDYEEKLYDFKISDDGSDDTRKGVQIITKYMDFSKNYSDIMLVRNIISRTDIDFLYKAVLRRKIIEGLL